VLDPDGSLELASALLAATLFRYRCFTAVRLPQCHFSLWAIVGISVDDWLLGIGFENCVL
jgi:hypothetical protein